MIVSVVVGGGDGGLVVVPHIIPVQLDRIPVAYVLLPHYCGKVQVYVVVLVGGGGECCFVVVVLLFFI